MKLFSFLLTLCIATSLSAQEFGRASYYADSFQGLKTASGELYNNQELTASHNSLDFGTLVKVTRLDNQKSVIVRINDRGPFIKGRIVDLSKAAAQRLDMVSAGVAEVKVEVVGKNAKQAKPIQVASKTSVDKPKTTSTRSTPSGYSTTQPKRLKEKTKETPVGIATRGAETTAKGASPEATVAISDAKMLRGQYTQYGLYKIQVMQPEKKGFGVQVGSYSSYDNVMQQIAMLQKKWFDDILVSIEPSAKGPQYKVILGQFETEAAANTYRKALKSKHRMNGFVVGLAEAE
ncbi:MAG: septal ring lytic transglycosylase RlpA family protein [Bacteroidota bacterium]